MGMNASVLILNANYEPLHVCNTRRAIGLILNEKAALVLNGRGFIHSACQVFPIPSVIRLRYMIHRPRLPLKLTRREVFRRDEYICQYCGKAGGTLTIDHVIPRHLGGQHRWNNVVTSCSSCNHLKGGRSVAEAGLRLLRIPEEPCASAAYVFGRYAQDDPAWDPFLEGW